MTRGILCIGGMDSSGGAGLIRDAATACAFGVTAQVAVTAVTAQTDRAVTGSITVPAALVRAQSLAAREGQVHAIKIGMLANEEIVTAVSDILTEVPVILDPVLCSTSGKDLIDADGIKAMLRFLLPRTTLITPNRPELARLAQYLGLGSKAAERTVIQALLAQGCGAVLVKGGHDGDSNICQDRLYSGPLHQRIYSAPRLPVRLRGTGCQLASGIAAALALGHDLETAIQRSHDLLQQRFTQACADH